MLFAPKFTPINAISPGKLRHNSNDGELGKKSERVEFNRMGRDGATIVMAMTVVLLLLWSWFTEVDEIAQAPGRLVPENDVQPVKVPFDGKVTSIFVKSGQHVSKGMVVASLEKYRMAADVNRLEHELQVAQRTLQSHRHAKTVLENYLKAPNMLPADLSSSAPVAEAIGRIYAAQQHLRQVEQNMLRAENGPVARMMVLTQQKDALAQQEKFKHESLKNSAQQRKIEEDKLSVTIASLKQQLEYQTNEVSQRESSYKLARKQYEAYQSAFKSGASSRTECLDSRMQMEGKKRALTTAEYSLRQTQGSLESAQHELDEIRSAHAVSNAETLSELNQLTASAANIGLKMRGEEVQLREARTSLIMALRQGRSTLASESSATVEEENQILRLQERLRAASHVLEKCDLRAPTDGVVALVNLQGPGQVVQPGEQLMTIVPDNEALMADVAVPNDKMAFLKTGQIYKLQFPAYPFQQYGTVNGTVKLIDAAPTVSPRGVSTYRALILLNRDWITCNGEKIKLRKGLDVQARLATRKQRLLLKQLAPLLKLQFTHFKD
ncbi:MAG: HlyD family efflux transporter periplasmic adaptor subunit [Candidatus Obscuribacterales bacterium]|nr:HlyD family efflux transporter periplasmic adaptor subunit [Candidatus Obscuribacterales bacterium]